MFDSENIGTHLSNAGTNIHAGTSVSPKPLEIPKLLTPSDDVSRLIEYLNPKIQEHQSALERQVGSVEAIAKEAKQQADSTNALIEPIRTIAESAQSKAEKAEHSSSKANHRANISILIALASFAVNLLANLDKIIVNLEKAVSYLNSLVSRL